MATETITVRLWIRHLWLLKAINIPLLMMGLRPRVPQIFIVVKVE